MIIFLGILAYLAVAAGFCLWDAFIGTPVNWDSSGNNNPPCWVGALLWPFTIPIVCLIGFSNLLDKARKKRVQREEKVERLRIVAERAKEKEELEEEKLMEQIEAEIENETKGTNST